MASISTIPVNVTADAAARVAELGMQNKLQLVIDKVYQIVPGLIRIDVNLQPPYDTGDEDSVVIVAIRDAAAWSAKETFTDAYRDWKITTFPPEVCQHFALLTGHENHHDG